MIWQVSREAGGRLLPLRRDDKPDGWFTAAYRDEPVDTQVDDGHPAPEGGWEVTSSASAPSVVAKMLTTLDVEPGMRVLEIGTGTGWNAALLAHLLGAENVTTIEIDPVVAEHACTVLDATGYGKIAVITGNGELGHPDRAPYDRVIATAGARRVPYPWIAQTKPGGRVVAPLCNSYHPPGVVALIVGPDGTAAGRLGVPVEFMGLRSQRVARPDTGWVGNLPGSISHTELHPARWAGNRDAALAIGQRIGDRVHTHYVPAGDTTGTLWLLEPDTRSWACVELSEAPPYTVRQAGSRWLFDEVAEAYCWWQAAGGPLVADWLVTVTPDGQRIRLA